MPFTIETWLAVRLVQSALAEMTAFLTAKVNSLLRYVAPFLFHELPSVTVLADPMAPFVVTMAVYPLTPLVVSAPNRAKY
jgi:hypothetical protein